MTAAERRALKQKEDKKSTEDPFEFLLDPRDKDGVRPGEAGYDPRTLYVPAKAWKTFTPFEKQVCSMFHECLIVSLIHTLEVLGDQAESL